MKKFKSQYAYFWSGINGHCVVVERVKNKTKRYTFQRTPKKVEILKSQLDYDFWSVVISRAHMNVHRITRAQFRHYCKTGKITGRKA